MQGKSNLAKIIISLPICIGIILFISANILNTTVKDDYIKVYGLYGKIINISDIEEIYLEEELPQITKVVNGFMLSSGKCKGEFKVSEGHVKLYLYNKEDPFIFIKTKKEKYYINLKNSEDTKGLYNEILAEK